MASTCVACLAGTCLYAQRNLRYKGTHKGHRYYKPPREWYDVVMSGDVMKKPVHSFNGAPDKDAEVCDLATRWTCLFEFLTEKKWDDGSKRAPGTVLVMFEEGSWKVMLNDKALGRLAFISAGSWEEVMNKADDAVRSDNADWRRSKQWSKK